MAHHQQRSTVVIEPSSAWRLLDLRELYAYRELLGFLVWRDLSVRYKQAVLGAAWAVLQPVLTMVVFTIFFGKLGGFEDRTGGVPYPIFVYSALLPWTLFAESLSRAGNSLVASANLIRKVYFPRIIVPLAAIGSALFDFAVASLVLVGLMVAWSVPLAPSMLLLPLCVAATLIVAAGFGMIVAALMVSYRDFRYTVPFALQLWLFVTPVIYPSTVVPADWRWLLALNPMTGTIEAFRAALLDRPFDGGMLAVSFASALVVFAAGVVLFQRMERNFADVI